MTIDTSLRSSEGETLLSKVAQTYGLDDHKASAALRSLADEVKVRIQRAMLSRGGVADVTSLVTKSESTPTDEAVKPLLGPAAQENGNGILQVLTGSKHISRGIAARSARRSGVPASITEQLLPVAASLIVGELQRQAQPALDNLVRQSPLLGDPLSVPRQAASPAANPIEIDAGPPPPIPGDTIPGIGRSTRTRRQTEAENPFDRLPDIVRRGGAPAPGGGSLEDVIRSIFGKVLGSNRGVIGTMIQIFLIRWLASIARRILSRVVPGR